jgi:hypothetical protein
MDKTDDLAPLPDGIERNDDRVLAVTVGGRRWAIPETERPDLEAVEALLRKERRPPVDALADSLAATEPVAGETERQRAARQAAAEMLADRAYRAVTLPSTTEITPDDVRAFIDTRAGGLTFLWIKMKRVKGQEKLSREDVVALFEKATDAEVERRIDESSRAMLAKAAAIKAAPAVQHFEAGRPIPSFSDSVPPYDDGGGWGGGPEQDTSIPKIKANP